jgi:hypothetical protein
MTKYKWIGEGEHILHELSLVLHTGDVFESAEKLSHSLLVEVDADNKTVSPAVKVPDPVVTPVTPEPVALVPTTQETLADKEAVN